MQIALFNPKIIPKICDARNRYISTQPRQGRWVPGVGWQAIENAEAHKPPTKLNMNRRDIDLLRAFFEIDPGVKNLCFWGCDVVEAATFHPFFSEE